MGLIVWTVLTFVLGLLLGVMLGPDEEPSKPGRPRHRRDRRK